MIVRPMTAQAFTVLFEPPLHQCRHALLPIKLPLTIASLVTTIPLMESDPGLAGIRPTQALPGAVSCTLRSPRSTHHVRKTRPIFKPGREEWYVPNRNEKGGFPSFPDVTFQPTLPHASEKPVTRYGP